MILIDGLCSELPPGARSHRQLRRARTGIAARLADGGLVAGRRRRATATRAASVDGDGVVAAAPVRLRRVARSEPGDGRRSARRAGRGDSPRRTRARRFHLVGFSQGGLVAFALARPTRGGRRWTPAARARAWQRSSRSIRRSAALPFVDILCASRPETSAAAATSRAERVVAARHGRHLGHGHAATRPAPTAPCLRAAAVPTLGRSNQAVAADGRAGPRHRGAHDRQRARLAVRAGRRRRRAGSRSSTPSG